MTTDQNSTLDALLGRYWELAFSEGRMRVSHGSEANEVLSSLKELFRGNQSALLAKGDWRRDAEGTWWQCTDPEFGRFVANTGLTPWAFDQASRQAPSLPPRALFWYRPVGEDGGYEGPYHESSIKGKLLREAKPQEYKPLYAEAPVSSELEAAEKRLAYVLVHGRPMEREGKYRYHGHIESGWQDSPVAAIDVAIAAELKAANS